jgi:hypothetical protein
MPFLRDEDLRRLTGFRDSAEYELDLRGLDTAHAVASVERMIERSRFRAARSVVIRLDRPSATSGETPFRRIGRLLVDALRAGTLSRCAPLPDAGAGFWVRLAGNPNAAEGDGDD